MRLLLDHYQPGSIFTVVPTRYSWNEDDGFWYADGYEPPIKAFDSLYKAQSCVIEETKEFLNPDRDDLEDDSDCIHNYFPRLPDWLYPFSNDANNYSDIEREIIKKMRTALLNDKREGFSMFFDFLNGLNEYRLLKFLQSVDVIPYGIVPIHFSKLSYSDASN